METIFWMDMVGGYEIEILAMEPAENRDDTTHHYPLYRVSIAWLPCHSTPPRQHARPVVGHLPGAARRLGLPGPVQCLCVGTPRRFAAVRRFGRDRSEADMPRASGAGRSDENDPSRKWSVHRSSRDNVDFCGGQGAMGIYPTGCKMSGIAAD